MHAPADHAAEEEDDGAAEKVEDMRPGIAVGPEPGLRSSHDERPERRMRPEERAEDGDRALAMEDIQADAEVLGLIGSGVSGRRDGEHEDVEGHRARDDRHRRSSLGLLRDGLLGGRFGHPVEAGHAVGHRPMMPCPRAVLAAPGTTKRPKEPPVPSVSRVANASTGVPGRFGSRAPSSKTYDTGRAPPPPRDLSTSFAEDAPIPGAPSTARPQSEQGTEGGQVLSRGGRLTNHG